MWKVSSPGSRTDDVKLQSDNRTRRSTTAVAHVPGPAISTSLTRHQNYVKQSSFPPPLLTSYPTNHFVVQSPYHYTLKNGLPGDMYKLPELKLLESLLIYLIHPIPPIFKCTLISNTCTLRSVHKQTTFHTHTKNCQNTVLHIPADLKRFFVFLPN